MLSSLWEFTVSRRGKLKGLKLLLQSAVQTYYEKELQVRREIEGGKLIGLRLSPLNEKKKKKETDFSLFGR